MLRVWLTQNVVSPIPNAVFQLRKRHWSNHVSGCVEAGYPTRCITIEMQQELAFTQVADESVRKGGLQFLVFRHPLLTNELAVANSQFPDGLEFIVFVAAHVFIQAG